MSDFSKTAYIFPGQGSQAIGMGKDIAEAYTIAQKTFEEAVLKSRLNLAAHCSKRASSAALTANRVQPGPVHGPVPQKTTVY